jgi:hypothetical protein
MAEGRWARIVTVNVEPLDEAAQALIDAGHALERLASGPLGLGPSLLTMGDYAREAGEKLITAGEQLKRAADKSAGGDPGASKPPSDP